MPRRSRRKVTEFKYQTQEGTEVSVPVWVNQTEDRATFEAVHEDLDIELLHSDINTLRTKVGELVREKSALKWVPYFYLTLVTSPSPYIRNFGEGRSRVRVAGILRAQGADSKIYWLNVPAPSNLEDGDIEELMLWEGRVKYSGQRPYSDAPQTGEVKAYSPNQVVGYAVLLPVTAESISQIRGVLVLEREADRLLLDAVRATNPDYKAES